MAGYGCGNDYEAERIESGTYCGIQQGSCEVSCSRKTKAFGGKCEVEAWACSYP